VVEIVASTVMVLWFSLVLRVLEVHCSVLVLSYQILDTEEGYGIAGSSAAGSTPVVVGTCSSSDVDAPLLR